MHNLVLRADTDLTQFGHLTRPTVIALERAQSFDSNVIYTLLHEPCYCSGTASKWSAEQVLAIYPEFGLQNINDNPVFFTGEMVYPFMLESYSELRKLAPVAEALAKTEDWPELYDWNQLAKNEVPVYAAVYYDDMYVDFDLSMETAGKIKGCKTYVTNAMYHDAIRSKMDDVFKALFNLRDDTID